MRLIKMLGLAAVAAVAAMAFIGATSASAADTQLCNTHTALTCGEGQAATSVTWLGSGRILSSIIDLVCDHIVMTGTPLALANPQPVHILSISFLSCETSGGDSCVFTATELPLSNLSKTGLDEGTLAFTNGLMSVECEDVFFTVDVECEYDLSGFQFTAAGQHLTAFETPLNEFGSDFLCPEEPTLDALLVTTANRYVLA